MMKIRSDQGSVVIATNQSLAMLLRQDFPYLLSAAIIH